MEIAFYKENAFKTMQKTSCVFMNDIVCVYTKVWPTGLTVILLCSFTPQKFDFNTSS